MRAYRKDDRRRIYEGTGGSSPPVTSFISGRYASRFLELPRESGEKIESRGRVLTPSDVRDPISSLYENYCTCNLELVNN